MNSKFMNNDKSVTPKVGLGCGTLILIALIVLILGNAGNTDNEKEFNKLHKKLNSMESKIENIQRDLSNIRRGLKNSIRK